MRGSRSLPYRAVYIRERGGVVNERVQTVAPIRCIGFIGAGAMGMPMIGHLVAAGYRVQALARRLEVARALEALGANPVATPADAAQGAQLVMTNVTATADVEAVLFGLHGVAETVAPATIVIDHSTISAEATRRFAARLASLKVDMLDAPVSGGVRGAQAASLAIMVGGDAAVLARAQPVLSILGRSIFHIGGHGAGQVAKACNQIVQVINIEGIAEAMHFARVQEVDLSRVLAALQAGFAGSKMLDLMGPKMVSRAFEAGIEARLHEKDFGVVAELADTAGIDLPAMSAVRAQLQALVAAGWGRDDTSSLLRVLERNPITGHDTQD